jgi:hypothetical protein
MFTNTRRWSTIWCHVSGCVQGTKNVHCSGKISSACNEFVLVFQCSLLIVIKLFTWMLWRKVTKLFIEKWSMFLSDFRWHMFIALFPPLLLI